MIRINLLPFKEAQRAVGRRQQLSVALLALSVALLLMIVPYVIQGRRLAALDRDIAQVRGDLRKLARQVAEVRDLDRLQKDLHAKLRVIAELDEKRTGPARVLSDLSVATPENLWLVEFREAGGEATLTGMALDNQTIARFMRRLERSPYFYAVDLVETTQSEPPGPRKGGDEGPPVRFKRFIVKAHLDYFGHDGRPPEAGQTAEAETAGGERRTL